MAPPAEKRLGASTEDSTFVPPASGDDENTDDTTSKGDDTTIVGEGEVVAEMTDADAEELKLVSHRKKRTVGIPVVVSLAKSYQDLRKVNPITLFSAFESLLGKAPLRSRFTAQGALLLDVATEKEVNTLLRCDRVGGIPVSARLPHSCVQNTCIIKGVPKWYTKEDLLGYLGPQSVLHVRRLMRRVGF